MLNSTYVYRLQSPISRLLCDVCGVYAPDVFYNRYVVEMLDNVSIFFLAQLAMIE